MTDCIHAFKRLSLFFIPPAPFKNLFIYFLHFLPLFLFWRFDSSTLLDVMSVLDEMLDEILTVCAFILENPGVSSYMR